MNKRADLGARSIVSIILAVVGFVILLFFLFQVLNQGRADKEACHTSVVLRGTVPSLTSGYVPLNCKTEKICLTSKLIGGKCEDFENSEGVTYIRVGSEEQVEKAFAEGIVDCWSMLGEGNIDLFQQVTAENLGIGSIYSSCVICSRVAFDKEALKKSGIDLSEIDVEKYMGSHAIGDEDISYLDYIAGENRAKIALSESLTFPNLSEVKDSQGNFVTVNSESGEGEKIELTPVDVEAQKRDSELQSDDIAILFMQISAPKQGESLANIAKVTLGIGAATFVTSPKWTFKLGNKVGRACATPYGSVACTVALLGAIFVQQSNVAANRNLAAGKCSDVSIGDQAREGCSVVRVVNYNQSAIGEYCQVIESSV